MLTTRSEIRFKSGHTKNQQLTTTSENHRNGQKLQNRFIAKMWSFLSGPLETKVY
jgi:hypothetical protein